MIRSVRGKSFNLSTDGQTLIVAGAVLYIYFERKPLIKYTVDDVGNVDRRFRLAQATAVTSAIRLIGRSAIPAGRTECRWVADGDPHIFQDRFRRVDPI